MTQQERSLCKRKKTRTNNSLMNLNVFNKDETPPSPAPKKKIRRYYEMSKKERDKKNFEEEYELNV